MIGRLDGALILPQPIITLCIGLAPLPPNPHVFSHPDTLSDNGRSISQSNRGNPSDGTFVRAQGTSNSTFWGCSCAQSSWTSNPGQHMLLRCRQGCKVVVKGG